MAAAVVAVVVEEAVAVVVVVAVAVAVVVVVVACKAREWKKDLWNKICWLGETEVEKTHFFRITGPPSSSSFEGLCFIACNCLAFNILTWLFSLFLTLSLSYSLSLSLTLSLMQI